MNPRQQTPARAGRDPPAPSRLIERHGDIDHRQPRAHQQDMVVWLQAFDGAGRPRVAHRQMRRQMGEDRQGRGLDMTQCEHQRGGMHHLAAVELQHRAVLTPFDRDGILLLEREAARRAGHGFHQLLAQIAAIGWAGDETVGLFLARGGGGGLGLFQPAQEMVRVVGIGAHIVGADVEQMLGLPRLIGQTLRQLLALALDQHDMRALRQQIDRQQRPGKSGADDSNRKGGNGKGSGFGIGQRMGCCLNHIIPS
jgi:hypothetical protein